MQYSGKVTKYKQMKSAFQKTFPNHAIFRDESYWSSTTSQFNKKCKNTRILDTDIIDERRSVPLYRTTNDTPIRQKYRGDPTNLVDAVDVSFSFVVNGSASSCHKLAEQNLSRNAIGRGGSIYSFDTKRLIGMSSSVQLTLIGKSSSSRTRSAASISAITTSPICAASLGLHYFSLRAVYAVTIV